MGWIWLVAFLTTVTTLFYHRASLKVWTVALVAFLLFFSRLSHYPHSTIVFSWIVFAVLLTPLYVPFLRYALLSRMLLKVYRKAMPSMSRTEREALGAGTVSFEGELFKGHPNWNKLLDLPIPEFSPEEKAFLEGPVETLCGMLDDWDITHNRVDLPPPVWQYLKEQGFFALIIPKEYGGKAFSAYAHSQILIKVYGRSTSAGTTIAVPNSLGPAELLLHYGTSEQKDYYLPRLARGEEIPCFALTGPEAGSDAGAMTDTGVVCWGEQAGKKVLGIRLNFDKRYITLAPIATVIGLAFKLYDPDQLLGQSKELGITCALIPRNTPGLKIGRRHFPAGIAFQNGPVQGENVFIPVEWIIGGASMAGQGWRMLMECLAAGRAISLPASALGGAKTAVYASGAYCRVRRQFSVPIGRFEGIEEPLARMGVLSYIMDATRIFTAAAIDRGAKPAIASAITKYHVTELGRMIVNDALDVHGGKGLSMGPTNYLMRFYESSPIAITVEGANILTRCLIIFGQGAMRCHPYIFAEYEAANLTDDRAALKSFDKALLGHMNYMIGNFVRTLLLSLTNGYLARTPSGKMKYYFQQTSRFSAAFSLLADVAVGILGSSLKRKESISARLGDILSYLYLTSATLKHFQDEGCPEQDIPILAWACQYCLYQTQEKFDGILKNFPNRWISAVLRMLIFPFGKRLSQPSDKLNHQVAQLLLSPTDSRARLAQGAFISPVNDNPLALLEDALIKTIQAEPIEKLIKEALQAHRIVGITSDEQAKAAYARQIISKEQLDIVLAANHARKRVIAVDDFSPEELARPTLKSRVNDLYVETDK